MDEPTLRDSSASLKDKASDSREREMSIASFEVEHSVFECAKQYCRMGFSVIPVSYAGKHPIVKWEQYQQRRANEAELDEWFCNGKARNIGIVCGRVSNNLVVLDFDKPESYERFFSTANLERETPVVKTARGVHVWLQTIEPVRSFVVADLGLDVIGEGKFVLAPPSRHPSGVLYAFANSTIREPVTIDGFGAAMQERCEAIGARIPNIDKPKRAGWPRGRFAAERRLSAEAKDQIVSVIAPFWKRGQRNRLCMYLLGFFVKRGISQDDAEDVISRICDTAADEEKARRLSQVSYHYGERRSLRLKGISGLKELLTFE